MATEQSNTINKTQQHSLQLCQQGQRAAQHNRPKEAHTHYQNALELEQERHLRDGDRAEILLNLGRILEKISTLYRQQKQSSRALHYCKIALQIRRRLHQKQDNDKNKHRLALNLITFANLQLTQKRDKTAVIAYQEALSLLDYLEKRMNNRKKIKQLQQLTLKKVHQLTS
ncbi:MAG: hypothetical protein Q9N68_12305 [Gammaproteobacteria bacterium]|nr:hypothetical protein [Gammaproteobacteria bacterium]